MEYDEKIKIILASRVKVDGNGCWIWTGAKHRQGYGNIGYRGKCMLAHRISWKVFNGPIPDGIKVCHKCDVTSCINPYHLFLGTQQENVNDAISKGKFNGRKLSKRRNKLNYIQVLDIKKLHSEGMSRKELQRKFFVGQTCIAKILQGISWNINWTKEL